MKTLLLAGALISLAGAGASHAATATPVMARDLAGITGKEGVLVTVELAPGEASPVHRHNANVFVYVLEGSVVMQVRGAPPVTLTTGQTFYEAPDDIHVVGRNASALKPARFLAFLVKDKGAPAVVPVP
jgi:quercetin dioxygenase-like cupin family protein